MSRIAVVTGADTGPGHAIVTHLTDQGLTVIALKDPEDLDSREALGAAIAPTSAARDGADLFVHAHIDPAALAEQSLTELTDDDWDQRCEALVRAGLWSLQAAHPLLRRRRGRFVLLCPTVALDGGAGLVPLATAAEALRMLAKSAARRWGDDGITVNVLAAPVATLTDGGAEPSDSRTSPALPASSYDAQAIAELVGLLSTPAAVHLTGTTVTADGGALMTP